MNVLVTGANGFLGRHVVSALLARGHRVRAMVRPAARIAELRWPAEVEVVRADLRSTRELASFFDGVEVLVHLAASVSGGEDAQFAATVTGTERLLSAMARTQCRRLVLASSFSVYDWSNIHGTLDESSPLEAAPDLYERDGYSIAKSWQEKITRRFAKEHGWDLTVLRPGFIWGTDHAYVAALGQKVGKVHLVFGPTLLVPFTHVENCADLFALAVEHPAARGETFNVVDNEGERVWSYLGTYLRRTGQRGVRIPIPWRLAYGIISAAFATVFRRNLKLPHLLVPCRFESRLKPLRYSYKRAHDLLGWKPPLDFAACLDRTFAAAAPPAPAAGLRSAQG
ncbi:MAG TPA: NAD(P)-dependent oxidoreductase [Myxococcales bacterium]